MSGGDPAVTCRSLTKRFGRIDAVVDLDLEVATGEIFGYLGPNGAGKTTTIRMLLGFLEPTSGSATVLGLPAGAVGARARIGYLPADLHVDRRYTTTDVVELFGALRGGVDRRRVDELLQRFELDPTRPFGELSSGNRRKVGIVQAFMHRPDLLVLDEPTSGLDPLLQHEFQGLVRDAVTEGATVFLSSHVLPEVELLADRVAILRAGQLVTVAGVADLRRQARQRIDLHVDGDVDLSVFDGIPELRSASVADRVVHLVVEGSVDRVLKAASSLTVLSITTEQTDLEDVFLAYYRDGEP